MNNLTGTYRILTGILCIMLIGVSMLSAQVAPVAAPDYFSTLQATPVVIDVALNDSDADLDLDLTSVDTTGLLQPNWGSITNIDPVTGAITYRPFPTQFGADTFQYRICDLGLRCDTTSVYVYTGCSNQTWRDSLRGNVFHDINGNGVMDGPEVPIQGADIEVWEDVNKNRIIDGGDILHSTVTTDVNGNYQSLEPRPPWSGYGSPVLFTSRDASENLTSTVVTNNATSLSMGQSGGNNQLVGALYNNLNIPNSAVITQAQLRFTGFGNTSGLSNLQISAQYSGNAPLITTANGNLSSRTKTTRKATWNNVPNFQNDSLYISPSLVGVVQEFVDHPGWTNSNRYIFLIEGSGLRTVYARDHPTGNTEAIYSWIHYSPSGIRNYITRIVSSSLPAPVVYFTDTLYVHESMCGGMAVDGQNIGLRYTTEIDCGNGLDDDGDGFIDCLDSDCGVAQPGTITASNEEICAGDTAETYSISPVSGATSYTWTVPAGATIVSGQGTISISVDWGSNGGDVCVNAVKGSCTSTVECKTIIKTDIPNSPSQIFHR
ncbi:MAG: hypothetical protein HKN92_09600 [Chitinophagales bacterium]|nr:hypothetical protein [Chitinophagales bacterium]